MTADAKTFSPEAMMRREIVEMTPYVPIKPFHVLSAELGIPVEQIVKLDANENPYGASPKALTTLSNIADEIPIYPDPGSDDLRERLAENLGVNGDQVMVGAGADELIELLFKLFIAPGDVIVNCPPTFGMYTFFAAIFGAREIVIERDANFRVDVDAIERAVIEQNAKMVLLCAPNNPDGGIIALEMVQRLLNLNALIVLDEAYVSFAKPNLEGEFGASNNARLVAQFPNLIVLRTLSKWAGLAGLRCGYGVFAPEIVRYLLTIKQPYNINVAARAAALASLDDLPLLTGRVQAMIAERERLYDALADIDYLKAVPDSRSNFILAEVVGRSALDLKNELAKRGVLVRYFAKPRLENHIRISIGTPEQDEILMNTLRDLS